VPWKNRHRTFYTTMQAWTCEGYGYGEGTPHVQGIFTSREKAQRYADHWNRKNQWYLKLTVVEHALDPEYTE
jgi:hypothetical protein